MKTHQNVNNEGKLEWVEQYHGEKFGFRRKSLSAAADGSKLGRSLYEVLPGRAWPYHYHSANEEVIYVLEGMETLRLDEEGIRVSKRDYITFPAVRGAHQVINSGYICFSTIIDPDVIVYPDSGKVGIFVGSAPGGSKEKRTLHKYLRDDTEVDYWDGEE